jgi:hypothetical protein
MQPTTSEEVPTGAAKRKSPAEAGQEMKDTPARGQSILPILDGVKRGRPPSASSPTAAPSAASRCKMERASAPPNIYSSSAPNTLPVLGLTMWICLQAKQVTTSYISPLSSDPLSANQPCTR